MVLETLVFSPLNLLTRLVVREDFIIHSRRESSKSYEGTLLSNKVKYFNLFAFRMTLTNPNDRINYICSF
jgi:hypothetical protein